MIRTRRKSFVWLLAPMVVIAVAVTAGQRWPARAQATDPLFVGAGDIAVCGSSGDEATAALLDGIAGTVYTLGDNAYEDGTLTEYNSCYGPSWGRHKARTQPVPGNHEYHTSGAAGYFDYFGAAAGQRGQGYYSYRLGEWFILALNSEIAAGAGSAQEQWLRQQLAANPVRCTLAYWHKPVFSSGSGHGNDATMAAIWGTLYEFGADVVLAGHDHNYERFAPQTATGQAAPGRGIREFVVGTGGRSLRGQGTVRANSEVRNFDTHGVLKLTLRATTYDFEFVPVAGRTFRDSGTGQCVDAGAPPAPTATPTPTPTAVPGNQPPSVNITAPANGATFTAPASFTVRANASDSDGTVSRVQFLRNGALVRTDTTSPYTYAASNLGAGMYTFTATATDSGGASTTSAPVTVTVTGATPTPSPTPANSPSPTATPTPTSPGTTQTVTLAVADGYDTKLAKLLSQDGKLYTVQTSDNVWWETEAGHATSFRFGGIPAGATVQSVKVYIEHYEEVDISADSIVWEAGGGPLESPIVLTSQRPAVRRGESAEATVEWDLTGTITTAAQVNDLKVRVRNTDSGGKKTKADRIHVVVTYR